MIINGRNILCVSGLVALLTVSAGMIAPQPAAAQGFFEALFGAFEPRPHSAPRYDRPSSYAPHRDDRYTTQDYSPRYSPRVERPTADAGGAGRGTHCVRLCDGRYFPIPRSVNGIALDATKVCSALCPMAQTKVFSGGVASDGTRYADLDTAYAFREKIVPDCSCTGQGPGGLAQIAVESDPTLRAGDIVVTAEGPTVFRGSNQFPYKTADFTPIDDYSRLNRNLRDKLSEIQVNQEATPAMPPQAIETSGETAKPVPSKPRRVRAASDPYARGSSFPMFRFW